MFGWSLVLSPEQRCPEPPSPGELVSRTLMLELESLLKHSERQQQERAAMLRRQGSSSGSSPSVDYSWLANPQRISYQLPPQDYLELRELCGRVPPAQCGPLIHRDHPRVIQQRFTSVLLVSITAPFVVWGWTEWMKIPLGVSFMELLGIRLEGIVTAGIMPLFLTMMLFLGPLVQLAVDSPKGVLLEIRFKFNRDYLRQCVGDLKWMRNHVVAPLTEELVFRACMLPVLVPCNGPTAAIFTCPLFFGVAHFHHISERIGAGEDTLFDILATAVFQFAYTYVFGVYSAFLFIRTGHLLAPVLCHSFCNSVGFPEFGRALAHPQRAVLLLSYLLGVALFLLFLLPLMDPFLYGKASICSLSLHPRTTCC
ncbi:CAAX prenyl protease 2 isoform X2 [Engraulis encrasicolus]